MPLPAALSGAALRVMRTAAGRRALQLGLLVSALFALGFLCGEQAHAAESAPAAHHGSGHPASRALRDAAQRTGRLTATGPARLVTETVLRQTAASVTRPASEPTEQPLPEPPARPVHRSGAGRVAEPVVRPAAESVVRPVEEAVVRPVTESVLRPVTEAVVRPVAEAVVRPVAEAVVRPVTEAVVRPVADLVDAVGTVQGRAGIPPVAEVPASPSGGPALPAPPVFRPSGSAPVVAAGQGGEAPRSRLAAKSSGDGLSAEASETGPRAVRGFSAIAEAPGRGGSAAGHRAAQMPQALAEPPAGQAPAGDPNGVLGDHPAGDFGAPRHGDAHAVTVDHRAPLRLLPGPAARAEAPRTRDRHRDIPLFPG
ncbi:hypothetical protein [Streptomyces anandii]|uniref:hypothetical protein n=1 Tax=Streptomyces anandii TaxID=285454 RepID=UPI001679D7A9|nr:hypothetical protein [Streptomyces anandii]GGX67370.1 hypothetical protein GCM10010510_09640 [Streptomyces anandii JCM 4720]